MAPPISRPHSSSSGARLRPGRVLILDHNASVAQALAFAISYEHDVVIASDMREALQRSIHDAPFDVILVDLLLGASSGRRFFDELVKTSEEIASHVVFMVGCGTSTSALGLAETLPNAHIDKPVDVEALRELIHQRVLIRLGKQAGDAN